MEKPQLTPIPLTYLGSALFFSWTFFIVINPDETSWVLNSASSSQSLYNISAGCMVATIVALAVCPQRHRRVLLTGRGAKCLVGCGLTLSTLGMICASEPMASICSAGTGVFSGALAIQWVYLFRSIGLRQAIRCFPLLLSLSVCVCATLTWFDHLAITVVTIALPATSELLFHISRKSPLPQFEFSKFKTERVSSYFLVFAISAVFAVVIGFFDCSKTADSINYAPVFYGSIGVVAMVAAGIYLYSNSRPSFTYDFAGPLVLIVVVLVPFFGASTFQTQVLMLGNITAEVLIFIVAVGVAEYLDIDPLKSYALIRATMTAVGILSSLLTSYLGNYLDDTLAQAQTSFVFIGIGMMTLLALFAAVAASTRLNTAPSPPADDTPAQAASDADSSIDFDTRCDEIAHDKGLSPRETDVFKLLARGYTSPSIQRQLYIASGTVSYHSHNIYVKLDVHSKQELIDLVQATGDAKR